LKRTDNIGNRKQTRKEKQTKQKIEENRKHARTESKKNMK
jgi:hypothetical protein